MRGRCRSWVAVLGLVGCARIVGLDELRGESSSAGGGGASEDAGARAPSGAGAGAAAAPSPAGGGRAVQAGDAGARSSGMAAGSEVPPAVASLGPVRVAVTKLGEGMGTVVSDPPGIDCGEVCSAEFSAGTQVTLEARTANGTLSAFSLWSPETGCSSQRRCVLPPSFGDSPVTATFRQAFNTIFVTSARVSPTLGGVQAYDRICNELATRAGINGGSVYGDEYVAVMSGVLDSLRDRLGGYVSLWQLADGSAFATTQFELFERDVVLRAVTKDENGNDISDRREQRYLTGSLADGSEAPDSCNGWTDASLSATAGIAAGGPGSWLAGDTVSCSEPQHLLCMSRVSSWQAFFPEVATKLRIWLSQARFVPGSVSPDEHCRANAPANIIEARALISYVDRPARAALAADATVEYARPDGVVVGTAADITAFRLRAGPWQTADGTYLSPLRTGNSADVWTGQSDLDRAGTVESTCNNWTEPRGQGITGRYDVQHRAFWGEPDAVTGAATRSLSCADPAGAHLYCTGEVR